MKTISVANSLFYRWRYGLGYTAIGIIIISLLIIASLYIPGGITSREISATVQSASTSIGHFTPEMAVNLPYHLLQKASFVLFGVSELSIKLPTILLSFTTIIGIVILLNIWFRRNVATLTALIAITTGPFLLAAQSGSAGIMYIFWPTWILLSASMISRRAKARLFWKVLFTVLVALSLYTPLSAYIIIALISAAIFHPHLRHTIRSFSPLKVTAAITTGAIMAFPLIYSIYHDLSITLTLLGIPSSIDISANLSQLYQQYLQFNRPTNGLVMTPIYELASLLLVAAGLYQMFTTKYTARSYIITAWLILLIPVLLINPNLVNVTFVPFLLLMGYGITLLIYYWYGLFPKNPYARVAGLIPLCIFIISLTLSGVDRFTYGYLYNPSASFAVTKDLRLLAKHLRHDTTSVTLHTSESERYFYESIARFNKNWPIKTVTASPVTQNTENSIATRSAYRTIDTTIPVTKIITDSSKLEADRFYIYKNSNK